MILKDRVLPLPMRHWAFSSVLAVCLGVSLAACTGQSGQPTSQTSTPGSATRSRLDTVLSRGRLVCGVSGELPGFSYVGPDGRYSGLDVDVCRAIAAALFDDPEAVEFRNLNAKERFTAVQTGEVDVLSRNTTLTLSRNTSVGMDFAPVVFYDGQGVMVRRNSGIQSLADLKGRSICTQTGTTNEQNLTDQMQRQNLPYTPVVFEDVNTTYAAYVEGRCEAVTSDRSQLISRRTAFPQPDDHVILDQVLSKEPLAPAIASGDPRWRNAVTWIIYALMEAEEMRMTSGNISQFQSATTGQGQGQDPAVRRFVGTEGELGKGLGLPNDFAARAVRHVGNYGEIYTRNLGPQTPLNLPRGLNNLWTNGGLLYAPPFR